MTESDRSRTPIHQVALGEVIRDLVKQATHREQPKASRLTQTEICAVASKMPGPGPKSINPSQLSNLLHNHSSRAKPGKDSLKRIAKALVKLGVATEQEIWAKVEAIELDLRGEGSELQGRQIPAVAGPFSPEACLLRWSMAGPAQVRPVDIGAYDREEHRSPLLPTPLYIRPLARITRAFVGKVPEEDSEGRMHAPFALISLNHSKTIQTYLNTLPSDGPSKQLKYLAGLSIRSSPAFALLTKRTASSPQPQAKAKSTFQQTSEEKGSIVSSLDALRERLLHAELIVQMGGDLSEKTELLCELLGITLLEAKPPQAIAKKTPHWAVRKDPIRTASAVRLLCSDSLNDQAVVVAEAPHYWAVRNRPDIEVLFVDFDLFPERGPNHLDKLRFPNPGQEPSEMIDWRKACGEQFVPDDYIAWREDSEPFGKARGAPSSLSPQEFCILWPEDDQVLVAQLAPHEKDTPPLSERMLQFSAAYFCFVGLIAREMWLDADLSLQDDILNSVHYQFTQCYGGTGGSLDQGDAKHTLSDLIESGLRISVIDDPLKARFEDVPSFPDPTTMKWPDVIREIMEKRAMD